MSLFDRLYTVFSWSRFVVLLLFLDGGVLDLPNLTYHGTVPLPCNEWSRSRGLAERLYGSGTGNATLRFHGNSGDNLHLKFGTKVTNSRCVAGQGLECRNENAPY